MNKLSTLPIGYKPENISNIRAYCQGNNGYYVKNRAHTMTYDWVTDDGARFSKGDSTGGGVGTSSTNIHSSSMSSGWRMNRLGNKSARVSYFYGDLDNINNGFYRGDGCSAFIPHAVGIAFKFSKADTRTTRAETRKQNDGTECRIIRVAGVYVDASKGGNNGKIYSYNYGTVAAGSLGFDANSIAANDKFCCYTMGNSTGQNNVHNKPLLLIGWLFELYFNHNGTGEQNPSGQFWQVRPITSLSGHGSTSKPQLLLTYPFENTKWSDFNPYYSGKMLKLNQARA